MDAGLIGLGNMGAGIARSLLRAGHHVTVYNRTSARADALRSDGRPSRRRLRKLAAPESS